MFIELYAIPEAQVWVDESFIRSMIPILIIAKEGYNRQAEYRD